MFERRVSSGRSMTKLQELPLISQLQRSRSHVRKQKIQIRRWLVESFRRRYRELRPFRRSNKSIPDIDYSDAEASSHNADFTGRALKYYTPGITGEINWNANSLFEILRTVLGCILSRDVRNERIYRCLLRGRLLLIALDNKPSHSC